MGGKGRSYGRTAALLVSFYVAVLLFGPQQAEKGEGFFKDLYCTVGFFSGAACDIDYSKISMVMEKTTEPQPSVLAEQVTVVQEQTPVTNVYTTHPVTVVYKPEPVSVYEFVGNTDFYTPPSASKPPVDEWTPLALFYKQVDKIYDLLGDRVSDSIDDLEEDLGEAFTTLSLTLTGALYDNSNSSGLNGHVLLSTGSGVVWTATSSLGIVGGGGGGLASTDLDTSAEVASIVTDETGAGRLVFSNSPAFSGTPTFSAITATSTFTLSGTSANIALGSNFLSGDGGDEGVFVSSAGNVSIGSSSPTAKLEVVQTNGDTESDGLKIVRTNSASGRIYMNSGNDFVLQRATHTNQLVLDNSGNVGIGTSTPSQELSVSGDLRLTGAIYDSNNSAGTSGHVLQSTATGQRWVATSTLGFGTGNLSAADIDTSAELIAILTNETGTGNLVFSASPSFTGTVNAAAATLSSTLTMSGTAANIALGSNFLSGDGGDEGISIAANGDATFSATSTFAGRVGIGVTNPIADLNVAGNAIIGRATGDAGGSGSLSVGQNAWAYGANSLAVGNSTIANTDNSIALGITAGAYGTGAVAIGHRPQASGEFSIALGSAMTGSGYGGNGEGLYAMAIGLGDMTGVLPMVTGTSSLGIFLGDQSGLEISAEQVMAIMGGNVGIGTTSPGAALDIFADTSRGLRITNSDNNAYGLILQNTTYGWGDTMGFGLSQNNNGNGEITVNNLNVATFDITGNLGIGTTTPSAKLSIHAANGDTNSKLFVIASSTASTTTNLFSVSNTGETQINSSFMSLYNSAGAAYLDVSGTGDSNSYSNLTLGSTVGGPYWFMSHRTGGAFGLYYTSDDITYHNPLMVEPGTPTGTLYLDSTGNVGVGTTTPSSGNSAANMVIASAGNSLLGFDTTSTAALSGISMTENGSSRAVVRWRGSTNGTNPNTLYVGSNSTNGSTALLFGVQGVGLFVSGASATSGNVGIGTTTPNQALNIFRNGSDAAIAFGTISGANEKWTVGIDDSDGAKFKISSSSALGTSDRLVINGNGYVGIGTSTPASKLTISGGDVLIDNGEYYQAKRNTSGTAINVLGFESGTDNLYLRTGGASVSNRFSIVNTGSTQMFTVLNSGLVGIGTSTPSEILSVVGSASSVRSRLQNTLSTGYTEFVAHNNAGNKLVSMGVYGSAASTYGALSANEGYLYNDSANLNIVADSSGGTSNIVFATGASAGETMRLTGAGRLGIGTTTPNQKLSIFANAADAAIEFSTVSGTNEKWTMGIDDSDGAKFKISSSSALGTSDRLVIDGAGRVGIGTSNPLGKTHIVTTSDTTPTSFTSWGAQHFVVGADGNTGGVGISYNQTGNYGIIAAVSPSVSSRTLAINPVGGGVGIGTTTPQAALHVHSSANQHKLYISGYGNTLGNGIVFRPANDSAATLVFLNSSGAAVGSVATDAVSTAYNTTSDKRVKTDIENTSLGLATLMDLPVRDFIYKQDPSERLTTGFLAQELYEVFPWAVTTNGDTGVGPLPSGSSPWSVDYGRVTPLIVKSVQDLNLDLQALLIGNPSASSTFAFLLEEEDSIWNKLTTIAQGFVDGVLTLAGVTTDELCLRDEQGSTCIDREELEALIDGANAPSSSHADSEDEEETEEEVEEETSTSTPEADEEVAMDDTEADIDGEPEDAHEQTEETEEVEEDLESIE